MCGFRVDPESPEDISTFNCTGTGTLFLLAGETCGAFTSQFDWAGNAGKWHTII